MSDSRKLSKEDIDNLLDRLHQVQQDVLFTGKDALVLMKEAMLPTLKELCYDIATILTCERVEIWLFNDDRTQLKNELRYNHETHTYETKEFTIRKSDVPAYFMSIVDKRTLAIDDIQADVSMPKLFQQLAADYQGLGAMLDASILLNWGVGGVICCLTKEKRHWEPVEHHAIASIADMLGIILDRYQRTKMEKHVYDLAYTDTLTGLNNQHAFNRKVGTQLQAMAGMKEGVFLYITLDQFTDIQGVLGYDAADQVLQECAKRLYTCFPHPAQIARIAFDHFAVFSPTHIDLDDIMFMLRRAKHYINQPMNVHGQEVYITISHGMAYYPSQVKNVKQGIQAAQIALTDAKTKALRKAKGIYQPTMHDLMRENLVSEMNLRKGLDAGEFELFYQPQVKSGSGEVFGFEALIRWRHPQKGLIFPAKFIHLAESIGLITQIGEWVIHEACKQLNAWRQAGLGHLRISVNLSPDHFLHPRLLDYLRTCINVMQLNPSRLRLEITETVALADHKAVMTRMVELRKLGFAISIDDFGTGYSAFIYLQHFPIQEIKIDRQFIQNLRHDQKSKTIIQTILQLGKMLDLETIAEGVETEEEWKLLDEMGCNNIQGFYFAKPLPVSEINQLFTTCMEQNKLLLPIKAPS